MQYQLTYINKDDEKMNRLISVPDNWDEIKEEEKKKYLTKITSRLGGELIFGENKITSKIEKASDTIKKIHSKNIRSKNKTKKQH